MSDTKILSAPNAAITRRNVLRVLMLLCCAVTLAGHIYLLRATRLPWTGVPIGAMSQPGFAMQHSIVLSFFACAQALVVHRVNCADAGVLTRCLQALALINAVLIVFLGYLFTIDDSTLHTTMLSAIASLVGIMMSCLIARRISAQDSIGGTLVHGAFLLVWLTLIPLFLLVDPNVIGAYQRIVGCIYLVWLSVLAIQLQKGDLQPIPD